LIGVDYHPSFQQIAFLMEETRRACGQIATAGSIKSPAPIEATVKYIITDQQKNRRMRRAVVVEWTLAGVLLLLAAVAVAKIFHAL
jgi:hypothetical protein